MSRQNKALERTEGESIGYHLRLRSYLPSFGNHASTSQGHRTKVEAITVTFAAIIVAIPTSFLLASSLSIIMAPTYVVILNPIEGTFVVFLSMLTTTKSMHSTLKQDKR